MKLTGSQTIPASRAIVWKGLNDPQILKQCITGCESIEAASPTQMKAIVVAKVGPVKASFAGDVTLSDIVPPESYRISGQGQGGIAGMASGGASVRLTELGPDETRMDYDVDAQIMGKMAMLGSRLIDSTARSLADQFFTKFATLMMQEGKRQAAHAPAAPSPAQVPAPKPVSKKPAAKKPVAKKAAAKKAAAKKPVAKKAAAKKAPAKKAAAKKAKKKK